VNENSKDKVLNKIDEETTSEEEETEVKITRVGYIEMKKTGGKKGWKVSHCVLIGGSFYWYKNAKAVQPIDGCDLSQCNVGEMKVEKKDCFSITSKEDDSELFVGYLTSETTRESWINSLNSNKDKDPSPFPVREEVKVKKKNLINRTKNKVVSKTATSALGKKVMKTLINEETATLLGALKNIVSKESGDPKRAEELEKNIIKIAVKSFLLIENGKLNGEEFLKADATLREAFELLSKCYNQKGRAKPEAFDNALKKIEGLLKQSEEIFTNILTPYLTSKNVYRISSAFGTIADAKFLKRVFFNNDLDDDLGKLVEAMDYYTQFHFN